MLFNIEDSTVRIETNKRSNKDNTLQHKARVVALSSRHPYLDNGSDFFGALQIKECWLPFVNQTIGHQIGPEDSLTCDSDVFDWRIIFLYSVIANCNKTSGEYYLVSL